MYNIDDKERHVLVLSELQSLGVKVAKIKKISKQDKSVNETKGKIFGIPLLEQEWVSDAGCLLPKFLSSATAYLNQFTGVEIGLFRKAGSIARQRQLRSKLEEGGFFKNAEPNDVASLLKQWLRELPEPVVPKNLHELFLKCIGLSSRDDVLTAVLLACFLMPLEHLNTLKHLLNFLSGIAAQSDINKMVPYNLAVVMAPNLVPCTCECPDKSRGMVTQNYTNLVELLIVNANKVGEIPAKLNLQLLQMNHSFPIEQMECSPSQFQKKHRSSPVCDLVNGIRKFVGGNLTPLNCRTESSSPGDGLDARTPSRSGNKRKADPQLHPLSGVKKMAVVTNLSKQSPFHTPGGKDHFLASAMTLVDSLNCTPSHGRRKSFGLLKSKRTRRGKSPKKSVKIANSSSETCNNNNSVTVPLKSVMVKQGQQEHLLSVPKLSLSPVVDDAREVKISKGKTIPRAKSDQPLTATRSSSTFNAKLSVSARNLRTADSAPVSSHLKQKDDSQEKSQVTKSSSEVRSRSRSPQEAKRKIEALIVKQTLKRAGSMRQRSRKTQQNLKLVRSASMSVSRPSAAASHLKRNASRNRSMRIANKNVVPDVPLSLESKDETPSDALSYKMEVEKSISDSIVTKTPESTGTNPNFMKRGSIKSSLRRGRPNTVKTGLKSELCPKYSNESVPFLKLDVSDVQMPLEAKKSKLEDVTDHAFMGTDSILEFQKKEKQIVENQMKPQHPQLSGEKSCRLSVSSINISIVDDNRDVIDKATDLDKSEVLLRTTSIEELTYFSNRKQNKQSFKAYSTASSTDSCSIEGKKDFVTMKTPTILIDEVKENATPDPMIADWVYNTEIPEELPICSDSCKRESIIQLRINNAGRVLENVHRFNSIATVPSSNKSESVSSGSDTFISPQLKNRVLSDGYSTPHSMWSQTTPSHNLTASGHRSATRSSKYRKSPLPPIPKFFVTEIEKSTPSPLKELTNFGNSHSPANIVKKSPKLLTTRSDLNENSDRYCRKNLHKKIVRAQRSESSPLLTKRPPRKSPQSPVSNTPSPRNCKTNISHSKSFTNVRNERSHKML